MRRQIRILHVLGRAGIGGVETFVRGVSDLVDRERFALAVGVIGEEGVLSAHLRSNGIPVLCLDSRQLGLGAMRRLHAWVRDWRPDVLHASIGGRRLRWLARSGGCRRIICHSHGPPDEVADAVQRRDPRLRTAIRHTYGSGSDLVLACSEWLASSLVAIAPELAGRVRTLRNGVDAEVIPFGPTARGRLRALLGIPAGVRVLGFVGRLAPQKGIEDLARVAGDWLAGRSDGHFLAIGDGPMRPLLEALRAQFGGRAHLLGQRLDAPALIAAMDAMVVTSRWEAFGIVNLEAMAAEVPVVAFDVDGVAEVIDHGSTGLLVPRRNIGGMSDAVRALMDDPERRLAMGRAGRQRVLEEFSLRRVVDTLEAYYDQLAQP